MFKTRRDQVLNIFGTDNSGKEK